MTNTTTITSASPEELDKMARLINDYGVDIIIEAIMFLLFIVIAFVTFNMFRVTIKNQQKAAEEERKKQDERFQQMFDAIMKGRDQGNLFSESVGVTAAVDEQLRYTCGVTKCDRAAIYVFHDGVRALNGSHLLKFSCLIEYATLNQHASIHKHKDLPINHIADICNSLDYNSSYVCWDVENLNEDVASRAWLSGRDVKSIVINAIYDRNGQPMGFACSEFILQKPHDDDKQMIIEKTRGLADKVAITMNLGLM